MKICRFNDNRLGLVDGDNVIDVTSALDVLPQYRYPLPRFDPLIANLGKIEKRILEIQASAPHLPLKKVNLLSPVANPGKIIAAPVNYQRHFDEVIKDKDLHHDVRINHIHKAGLFLKATSAMVGESEGVALRKLDRRNDHEVELVAIIGKTANNVSKADALKYVAGYCIGLDITIRGPEERSFRKSPESYAVVGPWLTTADEISNPGNLGLQISVGNELRQKSNTSDLIMGVAELIEFASSFYTLYPGDILFTGTPEGVSPIKPGDMMHARIENLGSMDVQVRAADGSN